MQRNLIWAAVAVAIVFGLIFFSAMDTSGSPGVNPTSTPDPLAGLRGKIVWVNSIDFDGRYPNPASWGYHLKDNLTQFDTAYPCRVIAINVGQDGPEPGSVRCQIAGGSGFDGDFGWTSDFHRTPHPSF
jgi:hypothetical protein